ncbi:SMP-30/gluconolactonase/LRE family protein [Kitasatospora sp. NPDC004669]|uniref:YncE family protein n=1 Tax=Kitasatospora sp. NPDC004669 TaxID=3154555 RepID=UPI0033A0162E
MLQAPALPGAQPISGNDRVYTADQDSNTVSVINPATNTVLGTIAFGRPRMAPDADVLGAMYDGEIDVHGLGFSLDGRWLDVIDVTTNAVHVIDTATNQVARTVYVDRAPHEGFFSPDGTRLWVAVRGQDYVSVIDWQAGKEVDRIHTEDAPSKVVFSPDGKLAYVNHLRAQVLDVINVASRQIVRRVPIPEEAGGSSDEAISPDGREIWLGMPTNGRTTAVLNAGTYQVEAVLRTGPRTNHPNFVTIDGVDYAYQTVGGLNETLVYRRSHDGTPPTLVKTIHNTGHGPHGIWPSPDNTRVYVALQNSDAVDVIDTRTTSVITTLHVGQSPMALVYVARNAAATTTRNLGRQGLGMRTQNLPLKVPGTSAKGTALIRALPGIDEVDISATGLPPNQLFTAYASNGTSTTALMSMTSNQLGNIDEKLSYSYFFANHYSSVALRPGAPH